MGRRRGPAPSPRRGTQGPASCLWPTRTRGPTRPCSWPYGCRRMPTGTCEMPPSATPFLAPPTSPRDRGGLPDVATLACELAQLGNENLHGDAAAAVFLAEAAVREHRESRRDQPRHTRGRRAALERACELVENGAAGSAGGCSNPPVSAPDARSARRSGRASRRPTRSALRPSSRFTESWAPRVPTMIMSGSVSPPLRMVSAGSPIAGITRPPLPPHPAVRERAPAPRDAGQADRRGRWHPRQAAAEDGSDARHDQPPNAFAMSAASSSARSAASVSS